MGSSIPGTQKRTRIVPAVGFRDARTTSLASAAPRETLPRTSLIERTRPRTRCGYAGSSPVLPRMSISRVVRASGSSAHDVDIAGSELVTSMPAATHATTRIDRTRSMPRIITRPRESRLRQGDTQRANHRVGARCSFSPALRLAVTLPPRAPAATCASARQAQPGRQGGSGLPRGALGREIKVARTELGIERRELAEQANVSYAHLSDIEKGRGRPGSRLLLAIAEAPSAVPSTRAGVKGARGRRSMRRPVERARSSPARAAPRRRRSSRSPCRHRA